MSPKLGLTAQSALAGKTIQTTPADVLRTKNNDPMTVRHQRPKLGTIPIFSALRRVQVFGSTLTSFHCHPNRSPHLRDGLLSDGVHKDPEFPQSLLDASPNCPHPSNQRHRPILQPQLAEYAGGKVQPSAPFGLVTSSIGHHTFCAK